MQCGLIVNHCYQFIYANGGCQSHISDGNVFKHSDLYRSIQSKSLNVPKPAPFPKTGNPAWDEDDYSDIPYNIVGDDAFQMSSFLMKPCSKKHLLCAIRPSCRILFDTIEKPCRALARTKWMAIRLRQEIVGELPTTTCLHIAISLAISPNVNAS